MSAALAPLLPLYLRERAAGQAMALGVLLQTQGSTYQKPGALMLFAADGEYAGLLSGGCLEADLAEYAQGVIRSAQARSIRYDLRDPGDLIWGLGLGCEGMMQILLLRVGPESDWQPLTHLQHAYAAHLPTALGIVCASTSAAVPLGAVTYPGAPGTPWADSDVHAALKQAALEGQSRSIEVSCADMLLQVFVLALHPPPRILLLGAGPDALPVLEFAARLGWEVTIIDHRPAYAVPSRFPTAQAVLLCGAQELPGVLPLASFAAAVVMSHHLTSDLSYLRTLARTPIPYVGLLGPPARRERLLAELGMDACALRGRLHAPVGLPLGGRSPESIALAIVAELHAFLYARSATTRPSAATRLSTPA